MTHEPKAQVLIVDDDVSVRESLVPLLEWAGIEAHAFATAESFLEVDRPNGAACLILDLQLPGISGLDVQELLNAGRDALPIVFISAHAHVSHGVRAMKHGAHDFLTKPFDEGQLLDVVRSALDRSSAALDRANALAGLRERFDSLTPREREVMGLVVRGLLNKQVAARLGTSEITVKVHRRQVMQKMAVSSLADLVRSAEALGLELPPRRAPIP